MYRHRKVISCAIVALALGSCSAEDLGPVGEDGIQEVRSAVESTDKIFPRDLGSAGGQPWDNPQSLMGQYAYGMFGSTMRLGYATNADSVLDLFVSDFRSPRGVVRAFYSGQIGSSNALVYESTDTNNIPDRFGADFIVGKFCGSAEHGDQVLVGAPFATYGQSETASTENGAVFLMTKAAKTGVTNVSKRWAFNKPAQLFGSQLTAGDLDGDTKLDLVVQRTPYDPNTGNDLPPELVIISDICSKPNQLVDADAKVLVGEVAGGWFGESLQVVDLGSVRPSLVVVDSLADNVGGLIKGAVYIYDFDTAMQATLRQKIVGKSGGQLSAVSFADLDGDGDLDMVVGMPMSKKDFPANGSVEVYRNNGGIFDVSSSLWTMHGTHSHEHFGSSLLLEDVNKDGVLDLLVGAVGKRAEPPATGGSLGYVWLYMGTKDGKFFTQKKFWHYRSNVALDESDAYGSSVVVADFDGVASSWLDIAIAAPYANANYSGRVDVMKHSSTLCFSADTCYIDKVCYPLDTIQSSNKCNVCDYKQDYFAWSAVSCPMTADNACIESMTCDSVVGCKPVFKPENTSCGATSCSGSNEIQRICKEGVCMNNSQTCGNYMCKANACLTTCTNNTDCVSGYQCEALLCTEVVNRAPLANAGTDQTVQAGSQVELDGSASTDPDGDALTYEWTCDNGIAPQNANSVKASFTAPSVDVVVVCTLSVKDPKGLSSTDAVQITVSKQNIAPVANAGTDRTVQPGSQVELDGSASTDPDGDVLTYAWTCDNGIIPQNASSVKASFTAPSVDAVVVCTLSVKDPKGLSSTDTVQITVSKDNQAPVANAGTDQTVQAGAQVELDGSASTDPDGDTLTYAWTCDNGIAPQNASSVKASFTAPSVNAVVVCTLSVKDPKGLSSTDKVQITVSKDNLAPVANAGTDQTVQAGSQVELDGSASTDPDGDALTYEWTCDNGIAPQNASSVKASFTAPSVDLVVVCTLSVKDPQGLSHTDTVSITVQQGVITTIVAPQAGDTVSVRPTISGSVSDPEAGGEVVVQDLNGASICTATVSETQWSCVPSVDLTEGEHSIQAYYNDSTTKGPLSATIVFTVKAGVLDRPTITSPIDGSSVGSAFSFEGSAAALSMVTVTYKVAGQEDLLCMATTNAAGIWVCNVEQAADGNYSAQAVASLNELVSEPSETLSFTVKKEASGNLADYKPNWLGYKPSEKELVYSLYGNFYIPQTLAQNTDMSSCVLEITDSLGLSAPATLMANPNSDREGYALYEWSSDDVEFAAMSYHLVAAVKCGSEKSGDSSVFHFEPSYNDFPQQNPYDVRGGTCSMTQTPGTSSHPLFVLFALGLWFVVRRRKRCVA